MTNPKAPASSKPRTTQRRVDEWEVISPLLSAIYSEFQSLAKKKPDALVSKQKIDMVNKILETCREVLADEPQLRFLSLIDRDDVPRTDDLVIMLSLYSSAMETFQKRYYLHVEGILGLDDGQWIWNVER